MAVKIRLEQHLCVMVFIIGAIRCMQIEHTFRDLHDETMFQNIIVHRTTGHVYVGAINSLFHFTPNLVKQERVSMGPKLDSPYCPPPPLNCNDTKTPKNSFSEGLAFDYEGQTVISCVSLFQGSCDIRRLHNISEVVRVVYKPIVPNNPVMSTLLFTAPSIASKNALYVGASYSDFGDETYSQMVPHISSRRLDTLDFMYNDPDGGTHLSILPSHKADISVNFVYGFSYNRFAYFIVTQPTKESDYELESKIVRICENDKYFNSYVEIGIVCQPRFNYAKGGYFDETSGKLYIIFEDNQYYQEGPSALCGYNMAETERLFNLTVKECLNGDGIHGPAHIQAELPCQRSSSEENYCGQTDRRYRAILGRNPIFQVPIVDYSDMALTSVAVMKKDLYTLIFLGTSNGELKKLVMSSGRIISEVEEIEVEAGQPISKQMYFNTDQSKLYLMTPRKISVVDIKHCEQKSTCEECTRTSDPVCGWCVMDNRCTEKETCQESVVFPHWLPSKKGACAEMVQVTPGVLSYENIDDTSKAEQIAFKLKEIVLVEGKTKSLDLQCSFSGSKTSAKLENEVVMCPLPPRQQLPVLPKDNTDVNIEFQVEGRSIAKRSVSIYDCRTHENCTHCTSSQFGCEWSYQDNECRKSTPGATLQANIVIDKNACPKIDSPSRDTDIVVHSGESKEIAVATNNLLPGQTSNVKCRFDYLGKTQIVTGNIGSALICSPVRFSYTDDENPYVSAKFSVTWGPNNYTLDNPRAITVRIYKCPLMVYNCGQCLSMDPEYDCGWCGDKCSLQKHCSNNWLDRSATCPDPKIYRFSPSTGPINGKTNLSVTGINLGKSYTDLVNGVKVAGVNCVVQNVQYEPSISFLCETEALATINVGTIVVTVDNQYTAESDSFFAFVDPQVDGLMPLRGPRSGGTHITVTGKYLDAGTKTTVDVGGSPCSVEERTNTTLICMTSAQSSIQDSVEVEVNFGGYKRLLMPKFTYEEDPSITAINPKKSILSGGISVTVLGERLGLIQRPELFMEINGQEYATGCMHLDTYRLLCRTPKLSFPNENITETIPKEVHYGFNLDQVTIWKNISKRENVGPFLYYPDPVITPFEGKAGDIKYTSSDYLVIEGDFASINQLKDDATVIVGQSECIVVTITGTAITCKPPAKPNNLNSDDNALVQIRIGNLRKEVGYLNYQSRTGSPTEDKPIAMGIILGVVLPIIAIIALLAICIIRRQKKNGPSKNGIPDMLIDYDGKTEEEEIGINHVSVKADMNGQIPDSGPYISDLLARIENEADRQAVSDILIPRSKLDIGELVGKGVFGNTYQARYKTSSGSADSEEKTRDVAVKSLIGGSTDNETIDAFIKICVVLKDLKHPNVLPLLGVCLSVSEEPHLVMDYLERGDLKAYVRDPAKDLKVMQLLEMAYQISEAMIYLEGVHVVHGNLAARNCLVTDDRVVKVTGFGQTCLYSAEYCQGDDEKAKTISKWLAQESIDTFQFNHKTDVWSYGVVMWELLTRGVTPYPDVDHKDLKKYLEQGHRLKKPRQCPESVYLMMLQCWTDKVSDRPTFQEVNQEIKTYLSSDHDDEQEANEEETQPLQSSIQPGGSSEYLEVTE